MRAERKNSDIIILQFFLIMMTFLYGGFYEYAACIAGIFLVVYFILHLKNKVVLKISYSTITLILVVICYGGSVFYAVDRGMAIFGFVKFGTVLLFLLCILQISAEGRVKLLHSVPAAGCIIVIMGLCSLVTGILKDRLFLSGRFGGTFQYSNTMALYLLIGIIVLQFMETDMRKYLTGVCTLYGGILMTGSRSVFVLAIIVLIIFGIFRRNRRWILLLLPVLSVAVGIIYVSVTSDYQNIGRFLTASLKSSTFLGRLLYWQDGLRIIADHPFGLGYEGYKYIQGQYQTGVYAVEFIHNDWLQLALDIGLIPMCMIVGALVMGLVSKRNTAMQRWILVLIAVHSCFDFNLQYLSVFYILILTFNLEGKGKMYVIEKGSIVKAVRAASIAVSCALLYFILPLFCFYMGKYQSAFDLYPLYTEAKAKLLADCDSFKNAELLADSILKTNPYVPIAYDAKAIAAYHNNNYEQVIENKEKAIKNAPYSKEEYMDYLVLLSNGINYYHEKGEPEKWEQCRMVLLGIPDAMKAVEERTSSLGMAIRDKPDLELPQDMQDYLRKLSQI